MAEYLFTISIGPVQSLIDAGRRTRDLWCGSWLLSESAKAAAFTLHEHQPGCLIFPFFENPEHALKPQLVFDETEANVANVIRAHIRADDQAELNLLSRKAKQAAMDHLSAICDKTKQNLSGLPLHESLWEDQKSAILESYSAWVVYENNYGDASGRLGGLIAARKATRDFAAKAMAPAGIPKSSLDGANESVINLPHNKRGNNPLMQRLGLTGGEELDVLGVIKRAAGNVEQFTPFSRIAADAWLSDLTKQKLEALCKQYEVFVNAGTATRVKGNSGCYQKFPYDSQLLFPARLDNARAEASTQHTDLAPLDSLKTLLNSLKESPVPYGVLLKADGDKMGKLLSRATSIEQARVVSGVLHEFARSVRQILRRHNGHAVYAGGDDILAFLPLQTALDCAKELAIEFAQRLRPKAEELELDSAEHPTLSVGLAVGHIIQPMRLLRKRAHEAEKLAKGDRKSQPRNALAICLGLRSGAQVNWRCRWDDEKSLGAMQHFTEAYTKENCPSRLGFELRAIAKQLSGFSPSEHLEGMKEAELLRLLDRANLPGGENQTLAPVLIDTIRTQAQNIGLEALANQLIIARWLAARTSDDLGVQE